MYAIRSYYDALLSYISALGAIRDELEFKTIDIERIITDIESALLQAAHRIENKSSFSEVPKLKPLLIELRDLINTQNDSKQKQQLRIIYNIAGVGNKLLRETEGLIK